MNSEIDQKVELSLWKEIAGKRLSPSHDRWHVDRVLQYARELQGLYGGDPEVVTAAVVLHDLGRQDPSKRGQESADESVREARDVLHKIQFDHNKIEYVLSAIREQDKPEITPSTMEGRILKDADFLAGFGAWGILRTAMWAGETGDGFAQVVDRLSNRMPKRFASLEFPASRKHAWEEMHFLNLFLSRLWREPKIEASVYPGKYLVFEGISGSGKDTQADMLITRLEGQGYNVLKVNEPTPIYKNIRASWGGPPYDPVASMFLVMADRYRLIQDKVIPALRTGTVVISVRNYLSTLVYQKNTVYDASYIVFSHYFAPIPDLVILYDLDPQTALERIRQRERPISYDEEFEKLARFRRQYIEACENIPGLRFKLISASAGVSEVASETWDAVKGEFPSDKRDS